MGDEEVNLDEEVFVDSVPSSGSKWKRMTAEKWLFTFPKHSAAQIGRGDEDADGKIRTHLRRLLEFYTSKYGTIDEYVIAWEAHDPKKKGFDPDHPWHLHLYLNFKEKRNVTSPRYFDVLFLADSDSEPHYNIKSVRKGTKDRVKVIRYCLKGAGTSSAPADTWYISNIDVNTLPNETDGDRGLDSKDYAYDHAIDICQDETKPKRQRFQEAHEVIRRNDPKAYVLQHDRVKSFLDAAIGHVDSSSFPLSGFFCCPPIPSNYLYGDPLRNNGRPASVIIWGPPNIGKAQFALSHGEFPVLIRGNQRGLEALDKINEKTDLIVFDDMQFKEKAEMRRNDQLRSSSACSTWNAMLSSMDVTRIPSSQLECLVSSVATPRTEISSQPFRRSIKMQLTADSTKSTIQLKCVTPQRSMRRI